MSKISNILRMQKKYFSEKISNNFKPRTILKLKTKEFEDISTISSKYATNYKLLNSSQIFYNGESYQGYLEFDKTMEGFEKVELIDNINSYTNLKQLNKNEVGAEIHNVNTIDKKKDLIKEFKNSNYKKCSVFNNNKNLAGIISCNLYSQISKIDKNDNFGKHLEYLEENKEAYEIIELIGENEYSIIDPSIEFIRVEKMLSLIRESHFIKNKLISIRSRNVKKNLIVD